MNIFLVFIGGGIGSVLRYFLGQLQIKYFVTSFPLATLLSNLIATTVLGAVFYWAIPKYSDNTWLNPLLIAGFCGGFSTFSTFSNDTVQLFQSGSYLLAFLNVGISLLLGFVIVFLFSRS
ncbi:MAG: fluoride efflux transporter CrcB [Bacteroidota bacterium]|jgi:CrcB protein